MNVLKNARPQDAVFGNPPPNLFIPKPENLVNMKQNREDPDEPGKPIKVPQP